MKRIEDLIILITGATDGIGRGTAAKFASLGAHVLLHGRSDQRLEDTKAAIAAETGNVRLETYRADFSSLSDVRRLADEVAAQHDGLDILINNAGLGRGPRGNQQRETNAEGVELRFQVNHLAPFLLTHLLLPLLKARAPSRIVNVASASQDTIDFDDVMLERGYTGTRAYSQSKLAMVMATIEWALRLKPDDITVNSLHPGSLLDTKIVHEAWGAASGPVEIGIESEFYLATSPDLAHVSGEYFNEAHVASAHPQADEAAVRKRLWQLSETLTGMNAE
ncbi:MAG: SDR family NAD(P)-dependent oxidoreductase [Rhodospirillales bacterium]